jgi:hypothetical protein
MQQVRVPRFNARATANSVVSAVCTGRRAHEPQSLEPSCSRHITCAEREASQHTRQKLQNQPPTRFAVSRNPVLPNPSLKLTRYGKHCKAGLRHTVHRLSPALQCSPPRAA